MGDSNVGGASNNDMATGTAAGPAAGTENNERTPSSVESTPEADGGAAAPAQDQAHPQKRKGGRKPIYATSEERKQRNRQAQAAFRERRTEYIKQLEANIKQNEDALGNLQQSHRTAADECLMLRYKNSLLERILLEKGIDVQTELQLKTGSSSLVPNFMPPGVPQVQQPQPPLQRTAMHRQHARRSGQKYMPKLAPEQAPQQTASYLATSPQQQGVPTPSSHASSPTSLSTRSPVAMQQGGKAQTTTGVHTQPQSQQYQNLPRSQPPSHGAMYIPQQPFPPSANPPRQQRPNLPHPYQASTASGVSSHSPASQQSQQGPLSATGVSSNSGGPQSASAFYPSPFQKHYDQLGKLTPFTLTPSLPQDLCSSYSDSVSTEHEYNTQATHPMLDENDDIEHEYTPIESSHPSYEPGFEAQCQAGQQRGYSRGGMQPDPQQMHHQQQQQHYRPSPMQPPQQHAQKIEEAPSFDPGHQAIDPNDPMLDADPFGLSASMHFPTSYSFDQPPQR